MFNRLIPLIVAGVTLVAWEVVIASPQRFWLGFSVAGGVVVLGFWWWYGWRGMTKNTLLLALPPLLLALVSGSLMLFISTKLLVHALLIVTSWALYRYLHHVYDFTFALTRYRPLALERFASYAALAVVAAGGIVAYGLINFLNTRLWVVALVVAVVVAVVTYQFLWVNKIDEQHNVFASMLVTILAVEFFWSISLFPITHVISGLSFAILYYMVAQLTLLHFLDKLERRVVVTYVLVGVVSTFVMLLSAQWL